MVNFNNYNGMRGSVHYRRSNVWNRYHMRASYKAMSYRPQPGPILFAKYAPPKPHCCGWDKALNILTSFAGGFGLGNAITGNQQPNGWFGFGGGWGGFGNWGGFGGGWGGFGRGWFC